MSDLKQTSHHPTQTFTDGTPIAAPFGGTYAVTPEPANPEGLTKPTQAEREALRANRLPDLMWIQSQVAKAIKSMERPSNGHTPTTADLASAAALKRLHDHAVRACAADLKEALVMHPERGVGHAPWEVATMKPGDIVVVLRDLDWIGSHCPKGTRLRLVDFYTNTEGNVRWSAIEFPKQGPSVTYRNIPPEDIEVIHEDARISEAIAVCTTGPTVRRIV